MDSNLTFVQGTTLTPNEFKLIHGITKLEYGYNSTNQKWCFLADGVIKGACRAAGKPNDPVISTVIGADGKKFLLVHEKPQCKNVEVKGEF